MKTPVIIACLFAATLLPLRAQDANTNPEGEGTSTNLDMTEVIKKSLPFTNSVGMVMVPVGGLWAGVYEVTQSAYSKVMGSNPSHFSGKTNPVDSVSWNDAMGFCKTLTDIERQKSKLPDNYSYTLPTEAQWETLMDGATLDDAVTSLNGKHSSTEPVGSRKPNQLGLYDTRGNVWEFCLDRHDPSQPYRVLRGGAWDTWLELNLRPNFRYYASGPGEAHDSFGFRCVLVKGASDGSTKPSGPIVLP